MKIIKSKIQKKEDTSIVAFLEDYLGGKYKEVHLEAIPETTDRRPDYYVQESQLLIEIKEIHDAISTALTFIAVRIWNARRPRLVAILWRAKNKPSCF